MKKTFYRTTLLVIAIFVAAIICFGNIGGIAYADSHINSYNFDPAAEIYYSDSPTYGEDDDSYLETEVINYATKTVTSYLINNSFPNYYNTNTLLTNTCANVAGANIIGFYDRFYVDLIPNHTPGILRSGNYTYHPMTAETSKKQDVINSLYISMSTNNPISGTSQTQYKNGLTSYVTAKGLSISYATVMSSGSFNLSMADTQLRNGYPISLFLSGYNFSTIQDTGTVATINKSIYSNNHIAVVYGYQQVNYYNSSNALIKSNLYLCVATSMQTALKLYIVNNNGTLNDAEAANIY